MQWTPFAGLTAPGEDDPITVDGSTFLTKNPWITDHLLQVGALTHRHDAHAALANPTHAMVGVVSDSGGALAPNEDFAVTYTVIDGEGGETLAAPALALSTGSGIAEPTITPSAAVDYTTGIMPAGTYYYTLTYTDGVGGETVVGPYAIVTVDPGYASAAVDLSGLAGELISAGGLAVTWRLWRSYEGEDWHLLSEGTDDTFTDSGFDPPDNPALPPEQDTTSSTYQLQVTLPTAGDEPAIAGGTAIRIYLAPDTGFGEPCFYQEVPVASGGATLAITSANISTGSPPRRSSALPGAAKINPDTDMLAFPWKRPVATAADLPSAGNEGGDVRVTLDDLALHIWNSGTDTWDSFGGGGGGGARGSLWYVGHGAPGSIGGQLDDDLYLNVDNGEFYQLLSGVWTAEGNLTGPSGGGGGGGSTTFARAYVDAAVTPAATWQKLLLDTVSFDTDGGFDLVNHKYVIPSNGYYQISANVLTQGSTAGGIAIYKNGAAVTKGSSGPSPTGWVGFQLADILECVAGDELELWGYFGGSDPLDVEGGQTNYLALVKL